MIKLRKKGFTLIELLAVIMILAIISIISTPIILNVVEDAKKSAGQSEANMVLNGINSYCEQERLGTIKTDYCTDSKKLSDNLDKIVNLGKIDKKDVEITVKEGKLDWLKVTSNGNNYELSNGKMIESIQKVVIKEFSVEEFKFKYEDGMTFSDWIKSKYNTEEFGVLEGLIYSKKLNKAIYDVNLESLIKEQKYFWFNGGLPGIE